MFTHYQASFTKFGNYEGPVHYPGIILPRDEYDALPVEMKERTMDWVEQKFNKPILAELLYKPIEMAKQKDLRLYCCEYGVIHRAPNNDTKRWYADIHQLFKENNIGHAIWNYKSDDFGILGMEDSKREEVISMHTP